MIDIGSRLVKSALYAGVIGGFFPYFCCESFADVIFDGSVGAPGALSGPEYLITEDRGRHVGTTLFHSFSELSIDKGERATFTGRESVRDIVSRVTGGNASRIYGVLRSNIKGADFYLINPGGIVFGPDAIINIDGSFNASTAASLKFDNGGVFEAGADQPVPIVSTARPYEFGFLGASVGDIVLEKGAQLQKLDAISLSARNIWMQDGTIIGEGGYEGGLVGSIHLVASKSVVIGDAVSSANQGDGVGASPIYGAALIAENKVHIDAPRIYLGAGANIAVLDALRGASSDSPASTVRPEPTGDTSLTQTQKDKEGYASDIALVATETIVLNSGDVIASGTRGSSILIESPDTKLIGGTRVEAKGGGAGGRVSFIAAESIEFSGERTEETSLHPRVVETVSADFGQVEKGTGSLVSAARDIRIEAPKLYLEDTMILADVGSGLAGPGNVLIVADQFELVDSTISTKALGDGGNITITTGDDSGKGTSAPDEQSVRIVNSLIQAQSIYGKNGGNITISNNSVYLSGSKIIAGGNGKIQLSARRFLFSNSSISVSGGFEIQDLVLEAREKAVQKGFIYLASTKGLDVAALIRPPCAKSAGKSLFSVAPRHGLPLSPEQPLISFESSGPGSLSRVSGSGSAADNAFVKVNSDVKVDDPRVLGDALRALAGAQQVRGEFEASVQTLLGALALAEEASDTTGAASSLGSLGNALLATGHSEAAEQFLTRAIVLSKQADQPDLTGGILNNLGNQRASSHAFEKALIAYMESARIASETGDIAQEARVLSNASRVAFQLEKYDRVLELLDRAFQRTAQMPPGQDQTVIAINLGRSYGELAAAKSGHEKDALLRAYAILKQAIEVSEKLGDDFNLSYALGNLGALYQRENRYREALYLTRRALAAAEQAQAAESAYRWHWQEGQLLWAQGNADDAIAAFRRAVAILEDTHQESLAQYGSASAYFQQTIAPVYLQLVDALLQQAIRTGDQHKTQLLRFEARATVEQFKAAELRDYFRDECVADLEAKTKRLEAVSTSAAVVYPILLPDRLELLVSLSSGLEQYTVPVPSKRLTETIQEFRVLLEGRRDIRAVSTQLYKWLVRPYASKLAEADIDTLVFVPDGLLRTVPLAALYDGERYLIDQYAVAVTPGLALIDPHPLRRKGEKLLLAGLSQSVQGFPALAHVPDELDAVRREYGGRILLDEEFTLDRVQASFEAESPSIVHIASHGRFTGDPRTSYILTYDGRLSMDRLNTYVATTQYREQPLELLVLSACETAAGDERAALGLAGIGVRAGARSALGSLWSISDEATSQLIAEFYRNLKDPGTSKAQALQRAQLKLLESPRFSHPFFWSPFLLINNWL